MFGQCLLVATTTDVYVSTRQARNFQMLGTVLTDELADPGPKTNPNPQLISSESLLTFK